MRYEVEVEDVEMLVEAMRDPIVQAKIGERMASLFCWGMEDLLIVPREDSVAVLLECSEFANRAGGVWKTEAKNLTQIRPITVVVSLPGSAKLLSVRPAPSGMRNGSPVWEHATFLPEVVYTEEEPAMRCAAAAVLVLSVLLVFLLKNAK
ncbi:hypothetical protein [Candidatus Pyrohabitans sp.]